MNMLFRRPLPLWGIAAGLVLAGAATGLLARRMVRAADPEPQTVSELRQRLQRCNPDLYVVQYRDVAEDDGFYLCTTPQPRERLHRLLRISEHARRWQGVVFCARMGSMARIPDPELASWGEHGMQLGGFVFFGDPTLLDSIRKALLPRR